MMVGHFIKRELESMFVHKFSSDTMPVTRLPINCAHYWLLNGLFISYFLFHPLYMDPKHPKFVLWGMVALFIISELMNGATHIHLANLRPPGTKTRGIPKGWGFDLVSCANYFWEILSWVSFSVLSHTIPSWVFTLFSTYVLKGWAKARHVRYLKDFDGKEGRPKYPSSRKALIPFLY